MPTGTCNFPHHHSGPGAGPPLVIGGTIPADDVAVLLRLGVAGVFLKPVDAAVVIRTLRTRLGGGPGDLGDA